MKVVLMDVFTPAKSEAVALSLDFAEPAGDEAVLWNLMKNDSEYAYFIQGSMLHEPLQSPHSQLVLNTLHQAASTANGAVAQVIQNSLQKFFKSQRKSVAGEGNEDNASNHKDE